MNEIETYAKNKIVEKIYGDWFFKKDKQEFNLKITNKNFTLTTTEKGVSIVEEFSSRTQWIADKLVFIDKPSYYIKQADDYELIFGELNPEVRTAIVLEKKFERN